MKNPTKIEISFAKRILYEEWQKLKIAQDAAIAEKLKIETGTLHAGGAGRRYSITQQKDALIGSLLHPDYERYQDIKRLRVGRRTSNPLKARYHKDDVSKSGGKKIHNRLIWGRMNSIAFRCMNDLRGEVFRFLNERWGASRQRDIRF